MAALNLASGQMITLYSTKFVHLYLGLFGQSKELRHFQNGEGFSSQPTQANTTMSADFHGNTDFFEVEDTSGQFTVNSTPASETADIMDWLYHWQHDSIDPDTVKNGWFSLTATNDLTLQKVTAEGCRIAGLPTEPAQGASFALPWTVLCGHYESHRSKPDDPLFTDIVTA